MSNEIIAAIIGSCGVIIAAVIAALGARKIVKESVNSRFHSYSDKSHDVKSLLAQAQNDVCVVVAIGDKFFEKYKKDLIKLLKKGIRIRYLILEKNKFIEIERYLHDEDVDISFRDEVVDGLLEVKKEYKYLFEIRAFHSIMTASYICTDIFLPDREFITSSGIQIMLYQYKTKPKTSPITFLSPKTDEKEFSTTVQCIKRMWDDATPMKKK